MSLRWKPARLLLLSASVALIASVLWAQFDPFDRGGGYGGGRRSRGGGRGYSRDNVIFKQGIYGEEPVGAKNDWEIDERFEHDAFRFARVRYTSYSDGGGWRERWAIDFPESDLNFPHRLRELTSMEVHPESIIVRLTDENLSDFPFLYIVEPGEMKLTDPEIEGLRRYLLNGGFLMVDDFWGEREWYTFYENMKKVFPDREPQELPLEHDIFHLVYDLQEKPMIVGIGTWYGGRRSEKGADEAHYRGIFDDKGRMMVVICHNTDLGDGWEEEGVDPGYFKEHSERFAYPLGINIITYAMTH